MTARRYALLAALALFVMFIAANVTSTTWFRSWRLDLTESQLYSISRGTQQTLDELSEPITLTLYFSRDAAAARPDIVAYAGRVREMLQTYAARSHGRVRFIQVDVEAFSDAEDDALEMGIEPVRLYQGADPIYFGIVGVNAIDERQLIPLLDPAQEPTLEYLLTRLIWGLENPDRTRVALITSLPIDPPADPRMMSAGAQSTFAIEMGRFFEVTKLTADFTEIPDVDVLAIIHPGALSERQLYAIDQFALRRGRVFLALDPASMESVQQPQNFDPFGGPPSMIPQASTLEPLLSRWGVTMQPTVVLDGQYALPVQVQDPTTGAPGQAPQPLFFTVPREGLNSDDLMTSWLRRGINFGTAGGLSWSERDGIEVTNLVETSGQTMRLPAQTALMNPSPYDIAAMWPPAAGRIETIAIRVAGNIESAYPEGRPAAEAAPAPVEGEETPAPQAAPAEEPAAAEHLARSETPAQIVVVADADFLNDAFYVNPADGASGMDNASFVINAIEVLAGSDALVSLRSRAAPMRRMEMLDEMEEDADRQIRDRQEELQIELQQAEQRLAEVQARSGGAFSGNLGAEMTPEETAVVEGFRQEVIRARTELRGVERSLRADINNLEALLVFINVWLAPLLIAGGGMFLFWRRQRRGRGRS